MKPEAKKVLLNALGVCVLSMFVIWPLFKLKYMENWGSIECTFIADGRFLAENWPNPGWQPLWYTGTRFDYVYPPALRYGTAALVKLVPNMVPARAYHLYTAIMYCLGIVGIYLLVYAGCRSSGAAWLAAIGVLFVSPNFLFMKHILADSAWLTPQRLSVLVRYGEGPHMSALAMLGLALAASYIAIRKWSPAMLALAGICSGLVVANNFYGATALATFFPLLVWAAFCTTLDAKVWFRAAAIAILALGAVASWFTPSYVEFTVRNLRIVSERGTTWSLYLELAVLAAYVIGTWFWAKADKTKMHAVFVIGAAGLFSLNVLGNYYFKFRVAGEPERHIPELDMAIILFAVEMLRRLWNLESRRLVARVAAVIVVLVALFPSRVYARHMWQLYPKAGDFTGRLEYQIPKWVSDNMPDARVLATGSIRFWWNAWFNVAQLGGGSEQGLQNWNSIMAQWQLLQGDGPEISIAWLQSLGTDLVISHTKESQELFHDWAFPRKFDGKLPIIYEKNGDIIYKVNRRWPSLARVVDTKQSFALKPPANNDDLEGVRAYANLVENGPDSPTQTKWLNTRTLDVHANVADGQSIVVQIAYDPYWKPYSNGQPLKTREDAMGQLQIMAPPGSHNIRLLFETPLENRIGGGLTILTLFVCAGLFVVSVRHRAS